MNIGDLVRVKPNSLYSDVWPESLGKVGLVIKMTKRIYIPAAEVLMLNTVAEFDLDELELVNESR